MILRFDAFELDVRRFELRGPDARVVALEPRVLDFLVYMARNPGRLVAKDELLAALWPDRFVSEASLSRCVSDARRALGDGPREPRIIETVHRRGFRFRSDVQLVEEPAALALPGSGAFVGRERELARLREAVAETSLGRASVLLVSGEPGIGKTRLLAEWSRLASEAGCCVRLGCCREEPGAPAYWPWLQVLRQERRAAGAREFARRARAGGPGVATLLPELLEADDPPPSGGGTSSQRFQVFEGVVEYLRAASADAPRVLLFDDLHRADPASMRLLGFALPELRGCRLLVVGAYREFELHASALHGQMVAELLREPGASLLPLEGFSREEVAALVGHWSGAPPDEDVVDALRARTGGNPFFLSQVVPLLAREPGLGELPAEVCEAIGRQLDGLPARCRSLLAAASVAGREFSLGVLESLAEDADDARAQLGAAVSARVVEEIPGRIGGYRFVHALVRDALSDSLDALERAHLHRAVGLATERIVGPDRAQHLDELAHHFLCAVPAGESERAVDYAVRAAERAASRGAYEDAVAGYVRALEVCELREPVDEMARCDLHLGLGAAYLRAGNRSAARAAFLLAADAARRLGAPERLARAALGIAPGFLEIEHGAVDEELVALLREADGRLGDGHAGLRARLLARLATATYWTEPPAERRRIGERAVELARAAADDATRACALAARCAALWSPENLEERLETCGEITRLAGAADDREMCLVYRFYGIGSLLECGDLAAVERETRAFAREARSLGQPGVLWYVELLEAMRAHLRGAFERAESHAAAMVELGTRAGDLNAFLSSAVLSTLIGWERGRLEAQTPLLEGLADREVFAPAWRAALARHCCLTGDLALARMHLAAFGDVCRLPRDATWAAGMAMLCEAAAALGDRAVAASVYRELAPLRDRFVVVGHGIACLGSAARLLGLAAGTLGRWDEAVAHLEHAVALDSGIASAPWTAHSQHALARALARRAAGGDAARARDLARDALGIARRLGMVALERSLSGAPGAPRPPGSDPSP